MTVTFKIISKDNSEKIINNIQFSVKAEISSEISISEKRQKVQFST